MTAQDNPRVEFRRAVERGNLLVAETTVREIGVVSLREALELTALIAKRDRWRCERYCLRWLVRWLEETSPQLDQVVLAAGALNALGGPGHAGALALLRSLSGA